MLYFQLVWVVILGWLVFSQLPDLLSSVGILIIGAAGVSLVGRLPRVLA
jgi:hypothetical protein